MYTLHDDISFWRDRFPLHVLGVLFLILIVIAFIMIPTCQDANAYMWNDNEIGTMINTYDRKCPEGMIPVSGQTINLNKYPRFKKRFPPEKIYLKLENSRNKKDFGRKCLLIE